MTGDRTMPNKRPSLEGVVVPDQYPAVPQASDVVRVDPEVSKPWLREGRAWGAGLTALLVLILGAAVWAALEVRWSREAAKDARLRAEQHKEAVDAEHGWK